MPVQKSGPLTQEELFELWLSAVDSAYSGPLVAQPNSGIEFVEQNHAQLARVSLAADRTFQSFFMLAWSGQTAPPAGGAQLAGVDLLVARTGQGAVSPALPIVLTTDLWYDHAPIDSDGDGPVQVLTGRRYAATRFSVIGPGQLGPVVVPAVSERPFAGYNLPLPDTITVIEQQNALSNDGASVTPLAAGNALLMRAEPDVLGPAHVGQYVLFTGGLNVGRARRVIGYQPPGIADGGTVTLAATAVIDVAITAGAFQPGETVQQAVSGARAVWLWTDGARAVVEASFGTLVSGQTLSGLSSGATASVARVDEPAALVAETLTASWRLLDWVVDIGLMVTNPASPSGAVTPMLDSLGDERNIPRSTAEPDDQYRERVSTPADTVSPNAIRRAINRVLTPQGVGGCLREVGQANFRGFFYDGDPHSTDPNIAFAFDFDFDTRPQDRFKLVLDYVEFRAFFLVGVPTLGNGEFGFATDAGSTGGYDTSPFPDFFDGFAVGDANLYRNVYNAVFPVHAAGVGFDLYREDIGCT